MVEKLFNKILLNRLNVNLFIENYFGVKFERLKYSIAKGCIFVYSYQGSKIGYMLLKIDITERKISNLYTSKLPPKYTQLIRYINIGEINIF